MRFKSFLFTALALLTFMFSGCATMGLTQSEINNLNGKVEIVDVWSGCTSTRPKLHKSWCDGLRNITLTIANPTKTPRTVKAVCIFNKDAELFNEKIVTVPPLQKIKVLIRGVAKFEGLDPRVTCGLKFM